MEVINQEYINLLMQKRRNRIPMHGISNLRTTNPSSKVDHQLRFSYQNTKQQFYNPKQKKPHSHSSINNSRKQTIQYQKDRMSKSSGFNTVTEVIRNKYRNKSNIMRIVRGWNFNKKGYITKEELKDNFLMKLNIKASEEDINSLFYVYSKGSQKLGLQEFISMIYQKPDSAYFMKQFPRTSQMNAQKFQKLTNLIEELEYNLKSVNSKELNEMNDDQLNQMIKNKKRILRKYNSTLNLNKDLSQPNLLQKQSFQKLKQTINVDMNSLLNSQNELQNMVYDYTRKNPRTKKVAFNDQRKKQQNCDPNRHFSMTDKNFFSKQNFFQNNLKENRYPRQIKNMQTRELFGCSQNFQPLLQKKTRFGATPKIKPLILGNDSPQYRQPTLENLMYETNILNARKDNKLARIRAHRQRENEMIQEIDKKLNKIQQCNLQRKRNQKAAYQYSTSLQNKWH